MRNLRTAEAGIILVGLTVALSATPERDQYACLWHQTTSFATEAAFLAHLCAAHSNEPLIINQGVCRPTPPPPPPVLEPLPPVRALPLGNDWSLENTISALRPLQPTEAQRRAAFLNHKLRIISALKPISREPPPERTPEPANATALQQRVNRRLEESRRAIGINEEGLKRFQEQTIIDRRARSETVPVAPLPPADLADQPLREYAEAADVVAIRRIMNRLSALPRDMVLTLWSAERAFGEVAQRGNEDPWPARRALEQARRTTIAELERRRAAGFANWEDLFLLSELGDDDMFVRHVRRALRERFPR